ncbi:MAG: hypothetical protein ACPGJV_12795 [Bacteriovoracaceae bacterium]
MKSKGIKDFKVVNNLHVEMEITAHLLKSKEKVNAADFLKIQNFIEAEKERILIDHSPRYRMIKSNNDLSKYVGKYVKLICNVSSHTETEFFPYSYEDENEETIQTNIPYTSIQLLLGNNIIKTLVSCGREKVDLFRDISSKNQRAIVYGKVLTFPTKRLTFAPVLYIQRVEKSESSLELIEASNKEILKTKELVSKKKDLQRYIKSELLKATGLKSIERSPQLDRALDFVILQALSNGAIGESSAKIHSLLIGAPASGKKLISKAIEYLNPSFSEIGIGKVTIPGVSASTMRKDDEWFSKPGALVKANKGTAFCQDFHSIQKGLFDSIMGIFSQVMEDGKVIDSTVANIEHIAETSIHLDINKTSDLKNVRGLSYHEDIQNIPINILSRFDFIADIEGNNQRQQEIALSMYEEGDSLTSKEKRRIARKIKLIIAYLRDHYTDITFSNEARKMMSRLHEELLNDNQEFQEVPELGSFQTRLANSAHKLSICSARLNKRTIVSEQDVKNAFGFIQNKFLVVEKIIPSFTPNHKKRTGQKPSKSERVKWIIGNFSGETVTVKELVEKFMKDFKLKKKNGLKRAFYRDLEKCALDLEHGSYKIN